ncbi:UNVERIFIED_CONTAM: hypothetical protein FKN15_002104 [Acipenser sinensis]
MWGMALLEGSPNAGSSAEEREVSEEAGDISRATEGGATATTAGRSHTPASYVGGGQQGHLQGGRGGTAAGPKEEEGEEQPPLRLAKEPVPSPSPKRESSWDTYRSAVSVSCLCPALRSALPMPALPPCQGCPAPPLLLECPALRPALPWLQYPAPLSAFLPVNIVTASSTRAGYRSRGATAGAAVVGVPCTAASLATNNIFAAGMPHPAVSGGDILAEEGGGEETSITARSPTHPQGSTW